MRPTICKIERETIRMSYTKNTTIMFGIKCIAEDYDEDIRQTMFCGA